MCPNPPSLSPHASLLCVFVCLPSIPCLSLACVEPLSAWVRLKASQRRFPENIFKSVGFSRFPNLTHLHNLTSTGWGVGNPPPPSLSCQQLIATWVSPPWSSRWQKAFIPFHLIPMTHAEAFTPAKYRICRHSTLIVFPTILLSLPHSTFAWPWVCVFEFFSGRNAS